MARTMAGRAEDEDETQPHEGLQVTALAPIKNELASQQPFEMSALQKSVREAARRTNKIMRDRNKRLLQEAREEDRQRARMQEQATPQAAPQKALTETMLKRATPLTNEEPEPKSRRTSVAHSTDEVFEEAGATALKDKANAALAEKPNEQEPTPKAKAKAKAVAEKPDEQEPTPKAKAKAKAKAVAEKRDEQEPTPKAKAKAKAKAVAETAG